MRVSVSPRYLFTKSTYASVVITMEGESFANLDKQASRPANAKREERERSH